MKPTTQDRYDLSKRFGAPVAARADLDALPVEAKANGQLRTVLADYSIWVYREDSDDWVTPTLGDGPAGDYVQEWTNPAATSTTALKTATATVASTVSLTASDLLAGGKTALAAFPRVVTFTTAGGTASDAPATATVTGTGPDDAAQTETVNLSQTAATVATTKAFKTIETIDYPAADGTDATVAIGIGSAFALAKKPKTYTGGVAVVKEYVNGAIVTNGTFVDPTTSPPYGTYQPNSAPNGTNDYAVRYELDLS